MLREGGRRDILLPADGAQHVARRDELLGRCDGRVAELREVGDLPFLKLVEDAVGLGLVVEDRRGRGRGHRQKGRVQRAYSSRSVEDGALYLTLGRDRAEHETPQ